MITVYLNPVFLELEYLIQNLTTEIRPRMVPTLRLPLSLMKLQYKRGYVRVL